MMGWYGNGLSTGGWVVMIAAMALFWGLVIFTGIRIFRGSGKGRSGGVIHDRGALGILDDRYARGEINREEYEARKATLRGR